MFLQPAMQDMSANVSDSEHASTARNQGANGLPPLPQFSYGATNAEA